MNDPERGTGRTTRLMQVTPLGGLFVIPYGHLLYCANLMIHIGRTDLKLRGPAFLAIRGQHYRDHDPATIVVDHATWDCLSKESVIAYIGWRWPWVIRRAPR